jgi:O-acetyl-ADP-ribose deacetylase (regulator of RNase III)
MELSGKQRLAIHQGLLDAFPSLFDLERLMQFSMDVQLNHIVTTTGNLREVVFQLQVWAESQGRLPELLAQATAFNPGNTVLREAVEAIVVPEPSRAKTLRAAGGRQAKAKGRSQPHAAESAGGGPPLGKRSYRFGNSTLSLEFGDITTSSAQALVSSDDYYVSMSGGVSQAILRAGGPSIALEATKAAPARLGDVIVTTAGRLPARHIFHAITIGPARDTADAAEVLAKVVPRCFMLVEALRLHSIAFPAIGSGKAGFPLEEVAAEMAELIATKLEQQSRALDVTIYLKDSFNRLNALDYISFYEQFASQAPRIAAVEAVESPVQADDDANAEPVVATTEQDVQRQRAHQLYALLAQVRGRRFRLEQILVEQSGTGAGEKAKIDEQLVQNQELERRFLEELDELTRPGAAPPPTTSGMKRTIFVSSTYSDLQPYRAALNEQIAKLGMKIKAADMAGADSSPAATAIVDDVRQADIFVGIVGFNYGAIDGATGLSTLELEFNAARAAGKPMLLYALDENTPLAWTDIEHSARGKTKLDAFRARIKAEHRVTTFTNAEDLARKIVDGLASLGR